MLGLSKSILLTCTVNLFLCFFLLKIKIPWFLIPDSWNVRRTYLLRSRTLLWLFQIKNWIHLHDDVIKWKNFPRYWIFAEGIHRCPVNSPHKGQWRGALMFSFICVGMNGWVNNRKSGDLRRYSSHCDVTAMIHWYSKLEISIGMRRLLNSEFLSYSNKNDIDHLFFDTW